MNNNQLPDRAQTAHWYKAALIVAAIFCFARGAMVPFRPDYVSPRTPLDYAAVVGTSLLLLFLAIGLWGFTLHHPAPPSRAQSVWRFSIAIVCLSAATVAVSNFFEDALGFKDLGIVWVYGVSVLVLGHVHFKYQRILGARFSKMGGRLAPGFYRRVISHGIGRAVWLGLALLALGFLKFPNPGTLSPR